MIYFKPNKYCRYAALPGYRLPGAVPPALAQLYDYDAHWDKIDSLEFNKLPQSALTQVNDLCAHALREGQEAQALKAWHPCDQVQSVCYAQRGIFQRHQYAAMYVRAGVGGVYRGAAGNCCGIAFVCR